MVRPHRSLDSILDAALFNWAILKGSDWIRLSWLLRMSRSANRRCAPVVHPQSRLEAFAQRDLLAPSGRSQNLGAFLVVLFGSQLVSLIPLKQSRQTLLFGR